jgi:hypothetical protein
MGPVNATAEEVRDAVTRRTPSLHDCPISSSRRARHFHPDFDEIYFMRDGWIRIRTYDPAGGAYAEQRLGRNELAFFPRACIT